MAFLKRLGYYMVGLSIGIVFLTFFFKKKTEETGISFCYFPNCRTLQDIRSKPVSYAEEVQKLLQNNLLDSLDIVHFFNGGEVDFGRSDTKSTPCKTYFIDGEINDKEAVLKVKNCLDKVLVEEFGYTDN